MKPQTTAHRARVQSLLLAMTLFGFAQVSALAAEKVHVLFNGKDLTGWRKQHGNWTAAKSVSLDPADREKFALAPGQGILVNGPAGRTTDLVSGAEFGDMEAHVEFCIAKHSNSGVYLMGRYELQIYESYGVERDKYPGIECGGIYPRWINETNVQGHSPRVNASKPAGQWQVFDLTFRAPRFDVSGKKIANAKVVKLVHNSRLIQENVELKGPTRGALWDDEKPSGPLRLQGDHGPVAYRDLRVKTIDLK